MGNVMTWACCCRSGVCFILACTLQCVLKSRTSSCLEFVTSEFALKIWRSSYGLFWKVYGLEPILIWTFYAILWFGTHVDLNFLCYFMVWNQFWPERFTSFLWFGTNLDLNVLCYFMVWNQFWPGRFMSFYGLEPILTWTFYAILWSGISFDLNVLCHFMVWYPFWPERFMLFYGLQSVLTWTFYAILWVGTYFDLFVYAVLWRTVRSNNISTYLNTFYRWY
jgi:hypothetical protein